MILQYSYSLANVTPSDSLSLKHDHLPAFQFLLFSTSSTPLLLIIQHISFYKLPFYLYTFFLSLFWNILLYIIFSSETNGVTISFNNSYSGYVGGGGTTPNRKFTHRGTRSRCQSCSHHYTSRCHRSLIRIRTNIHCRRWPSCYYYGERTCCRWYHSDWSSRYQERDNRLKHPN